MANKQFTPDEIQTIKEKLYSPKSSDRTIAAKKIGLNLIYELKDDLWNAYLKEKQDKRTFDAQVMMVKGIGRLGIKEALSTMLENCKNYDMTDFVSATAFVRLERETKTDIKPILALFQIKNKRIINGALNALTYDKIVLDGKDIKTLIDEVEQAYEPMPIGVTDLREGLISAMVYWKNSSLVEKYLQEMVKSDLKIVREKAESALKGKIIYTYEY